MTLAQQQQYLALATGSRRTRSNPWTSWRAPYLRVEYTLPGAFEWRGTGTRGTSAAFSPARGSTPEQALQAALRIDAHAEPAQIVPTTLAMAFRFTMGTPKTGRYTRVIRADSHGTSSQVDRSLPEGGG